MCDPERSLQLDPSNYISTIMGVQGLYLNFLSTNCIRKWNSRAINGPLMVLYLLLG